MRILLSAAATFLIFRNVRIRSADKQLLAVLECHAAAVGSVLPVLGLISLNGKFRAHFERPLGKPAPQHDVRAAAFHHPIGDRAVRVLHVDMNPGVGIDPFHLGDGSGQMDRLALIELRLKRVMRPQRRHHEKQTRAAAAIANLVRIRTPSCSEILSYFEPYFVFLLVRACAAQNIAHGDIALVTGIFQKLVMIVRFKGIKMVQGWVQVLDRRSWPGN